MIWNNIIIYDDGTVEKKINNESWYDEKNKKINKSKILKILKSSESDLMKKIFEIENKLLSSTRPSFYIINDFVFIKQSGKYEYFTGEINYTPYLNGNKIKFEE